MSKFEIFCKEIIKLSDSDNFNEAVKEWYLIGLDEEKTNCICGQFIINNCIIQNKLNHNISIVGNVCIKKFMNNNNILINDMNLQLYNNKCKKNNKLYKKCKCGKKIKLKELNEHDWKHKCLKCFFSRG